MVSILQFLVKRDTLNLTHKLDSMMFDMFDMFSLDALLMYERIIRVLDAHYIDSKHSSRCGTCLEGFETVVWRLRNSVLDMLLSFMTSLIYFAISGLSLHTVTIGFPGE